MALDLYLRVRVVEVSADLHGALETAFDDHAPSGENRIEAAYRLACQRFGTPVMGLRVRVSSEIPMAAGLGSSAAACVAGLRLYEAARAIPLDEGDMLHMATEIEHHPDNAAAALLGGMTLSCQRDDGRSSRARGAGPRRSGSWWRRRKRASKPSRREPCCRRRCR